MTPIKALIISAAIATITACGGGDIPSIKEIESAPQKHRLDGWAVGYRYTTEGISWPYYLNENRWFSTQQAVFDDMTKCERLTKIGVPQYCNLSTVHFDGPAVLDPALPQDAPRVGGHYWGCVGDCSPGNSWDYQSVWINIDKSTVKTRD